MQSAKTLIELLEKASVPAGLDQNNWFEEFSYPEYLALVHADPRVARSSFQRLRDMIRSYGSEEYENFGRTVRHFKAFDQIDPKERLIGIDEHLSDLVRTIEAGARRLGTEKRILLMVGPVGTGKSTAVNTLKKGLEMYSRTPDGRLYTHVWNSHDDEAVKAILGNEDVAPCPIHNDPLSLLPQEHELGILPWARQYVNDALSGNDLYENEIVLSGGTCAFCRKIYSDLFRHYQGDLVKVFSHVSVRRFLISEVDRIGLGTFKPKDEKNQDTTELEGDVNYRKLALLGVENDPRAFNYQLGEFFVANRGLLEFVEIFKLAREFLYDLLDATQFGLVKPRGMPNSKVDLVILAHTNWPEYEKVKNDVTQEAIRDRAALVEVCYPLRASHLSEIHASRYSDLFERAEVHQAPHLFDLAGYWTALTAVSDPKNQQLSRLDKVKLYDGETVDGVNNDRVRDILDESRTEGRTGLSPRYIQEMVGKLILDPEVQEEQCANPFLFLKVLDSHLDEHPTVPKDKVDEYRKQLTRVREFYQKELITADVRRAVAGDDEACSRRFAEYLAHVKAFVQKEKIKNARTNEMEAPDENVMRTLEERMDVSEAKAPDFRRELMNKIGASAVENKKFDYKSDPKIRRAIELDLFESAQGQVRLAAVSRSATADKDTQKKIDDIKSNLKDMGYCDSCASAVLEVVSSPYARGQRETSDS